MTADGEPDDPRRGLDRLPADTETPKTPDRSVREETRLEFREETHYRPLIVSPLPPPEVLGAYKEVQSDIPERILHLVENRPNTGRRSNHGHWTTGIAWKPSA